MRVIFFFLFFFFSFFFVKNIPNTPANENILPTVLYLNILLLFYRIYFVVFH